VRRAFDEARRLEHGWIGPEHLVLAVLHADEGDRGRAALESLGITAASFERDVAGVIAGSRPAPPPYEGYSVVNPACHEVLGCARGFAFATGDGTVTGAELLLGVIYGDQSSITAWLARAGLSSDALLDALARCGVALPSTSPPPPEREPQFVHHIELSRDETTRVAGLLVQRHRSPDGPRWAFNYDGPDRGWLDAEAEIDLAALVDEVRRSTERDRA
jgi:ATP-dependent Clp protease ATP-binding subunit ClpA